MHAVQVCGHFIGAAVKVPQLQFLAKVVLVVVQRQVLWSKQCRTLFGSSQLQSF